MFSPYCVTFNVQGATSKQYGKPNQDSARSLSNRYSVNGKDRAIHTLSIADGHGGVEHMHSDEGSDIATRCTIGLASSLIHNSSTIEDVGDKMKGFILRNWRQRLPLDKPATAYGTTIRAIIYDETAQKAVLIACGDGHTFIKYKGSPTITEWPADTDHSESLPEASASLCSTDGSSIITECIDFSNVEWCCTMSDGFSRLAKSLNEYVLDIIKEQYKYSPADFAIKFAEDVAKIASYYDDDTSIAMLKNSRFLSLSQDRESALDVEK
jgi:hypothetical protein